MHKRILLAALMMSSAGIFTQPVHAQSTGSTDSINGIEEVTVTARRRNESEERVPAAVTPISAEDLRVTGTKSAIDLQNLAPSLTVSADLGSRDTDIFTIRGQTQPFGGADPGVQTYFAEVPFNASGRGTDFDLDNVQVLNGPQGTLFGRNTTGGAILFEPKRPGDQFGGYLDVTGGSYDDREVQAAINVPLDDTLAVRVAGDLAQRDGFTKDITTGQNLDNVNYQAFRAGVTWRPFAHFQNYAVFDYLHDHNNGTGASLTAVNPATLDNLATQFLGAPCTVPPASATCAALEGFQAEMLGALAQQQALGPRRTTSSIPLSFRHDSWGVTDIATYDVTDHLHLRNIFGYRVDKQQPAFDYDGSDLPILDIPNARTWESNSYQVTEEIQLLGETGDDRFNWIAGFYHELDQPNGYSEVERDTFGGAQPMGSPFFGFGNTEVDELNNGGASDAVYGSATYNASDWLNGLSFTAGGRYTWDHKVATARTCISIDIASPCPFPLTSLPATKDSAHFHAPTWTLAADYQVTDDTMVYATYRRGYKSGGFNSGAGAATDFAEFKPEYLTDVEAGTKNNWTILGVPGRTNFDAYYGWYQDIQKNDEIGISQTFLVPPPPGAPPGTPPTPFTVTTPAALTFNAARATVKGVELQSTIIPNENVELSVFYSYTDASYDRFVLPLAVSVDPFGNQTLIGTADHAGNPFAYTPRNKLGLSGRFHIPIDPAWGSPTFSAQWYTQSRVWFSDLSDLEPDASQKSYDLVNLRLDWDNFAGSPFDLALFDTNATNETYKVGANALEHLTGTTASIYGEPRMYGVELRVRFGADAH